MTRQTVLHIWTGVTWKAPVVQPGTLKTAKETVKNTLGTLRQRDRDILLDLFYHKLGREEVCQKHGVTGDEIRMILFHARSSFQQSWERPAAA